MKLYCHQSVHYHLMLLNNQLQVKLLQLTIILILILILKQTSLKLIKRSINNNMIEDKVKGGLNDCIDVHSDTNVCN